MRKRTPIPAWFTVPKGMNINHQGYLRFHAPHHLRDKYAHRVYCNRLMQETYGRDLRANEEVHHLCGEPLCWPPTDFHLLILDAALHHLSDAGRSPAWKRKAGNGTKAISFESGPE